jgi:diguanylate cyclase (GGDEF)-like protein
MRHHRRMIDNAALQVLVFRGAAEAALVQALRAQGWHVELAEAWPPVTAADAVLLVARDAAALAAQAHDTGWTPLALDAAVVVASAPAALAEELALLHRGAEAVVPLDDIDAVPRAIAHAVARKRVERAARTAYATDLATGLPHQAQLLEHMTQLLALREREPAPMVLLVLRVHGIEAAAQKLGPEAGNVLRRKVAVRLRGGLRASDVVAAIAPDAFGVLLGRLEAKGDGERVATKLVRALQQPFTVAGQPCSVAAAVGMAIWPDHGREAQALLQRASAQAGGVAAMGSGYGALATRSGAEAANDPPA